MPQFFDIHSHLNSKDYDSDLDEVIGRLKQTNTYTIVVGTDLESSKKAVELAEKYDGIYASIGVHPVDNPTRVFDEEFLILVKHPKVVAVGECGLDFFHADKNDQEEISRQKDLFFKQINLALEYEKPIMIHSRDAYSELLDFLEPIAKKGGSKLKGNVHFFAGDIETAHRFFNIGFTISFTGVITFARNYDEVVRLSPLNMIMSETDAPYVSPDPYRGKRNEPSYVSEVVKKIAEIKEEEFEKVKNAMVENALRVFNINL
jgi:TatD DNase family protein